MNFKTLKNTVASLGLGAALLLTAGMASSSTLFAQDWRGRDQDRQDWRGRDRDRQDWQRRDRDRYEDNWRERREERRGYDDGFDRGRDDARSRRFFDPNKFGSYRNGNREYREGFRRGYAEGFRQFERRWRW